MAKASMKPGGGGRFKKMAQFAAKGRKRAAKRGKAKR